MSGPLLSTAPAMPLPAATRGSCGMNGALRVLAEASPEGSFVPVPRDALLRLLDDVPVASASEEKEKDQLLTAEEVAARLGMSKEWVYRKAKKLPFTRRIGTRSLRFSSKGLERWQTRQAGSGEGH